MIFQLLKRLIPDIVYNIVLVGSGVYWVGLNQGPKDCLEYTYKHNMHRVFGLFHMCHVLVLDLIAYNNSWSKPALHLDLREGQKMAMK